MAWGYGPSVVHRSACDYWRTWFLEECESAQLFGLTKGHLPLVAKAGIGVVPYHPGTRVFLEDAPWFPHSGRRMHRVCGPYEVRVIDRLPELCTRHTRPTAASSYTTTRAQTRALGSTVLRSDGRLMASWSSFARWPASSSTFPTDFGSFAGRSGRLNTWPTTQVAGSARGSLGEIECLK